MAIIDQEEFKLNRTAALESGDVNTIRLWAKKYGYKHILTMTDDEILDLIIKAPKWD